jgi:hypothetical protein
MRHSQHRRSHAVAFGLVCLFGLALAGCAGGVTESSAGTSSSMSTGSSTGEAAAPSISGTPSTTAVVGTEYSFQPSAWDTAGDALTFSVQNLPGWATFDTTTGKLSGTPAAADVGTTAAISITVSDGALSAQLAPFQIDVEPEAAGSGGSLKLSGTPPTTVKAGSHYVFQPSVAAPAGAKLTFSITHLPSWAAFNVQTGQLSGTPSTAAVGTYSGLAISVSDGQGNASLAPFSIQVEAASTPPSPPVISGTPSTEVKAGKNYNFTPAARDGSGIPLTFSIRNKPDWAAFSAGTGEVRGTPANNQVGTYGNIVISVSDGQASASLPAFSIKVMPASAPPGPPTISGSPGTEIQANQHYSFTPVASDPAGNPLTFRVVNTPAWASFNTSTGQLSGTPTTDDLGTTSGIVISVSDGTASASLPAFAITVSAAAAANPTVTLTASSSSVSSGAAATLTWSSTNATSCTASGGWSGSEPTSGSASTGALSSTTTFTLTCDGAAGSAPASASTTVSVQSSSGGGGTVSRPPYNTGYGLFVLNGKLYDSKGVEFRIRGVNLCHYDSTGYSGPGIARSNANTVRVGFYLSSISTSTYVSTLQTYISNSENVVGTMFYVPGTRNVTSGDQSTADLASVVQNWVANFPSYSPLQQHLIIDVANEWGPSNSATWQSAYISAIASLRAAGYTAPIMVDTGGWGQDQADLLNYAQAVFNSDPQKNVIFSLHVYYGQGNGWTAASLNTYAQQLKAMAASAGMVFVFGEFGPGLNYGPSPTSLTPQEVIGAAEGAGIGWMGWAWDDNNLANGASSNVSFSMTFNGPGIYTVASDLTTYGQQMVLSDYALKLAQKATDF